MLEGFGTTQAAEEVSCENHLTRKFDAQGSEALTQNGNSKQWHTYDYKTLLETMSTTVLIVLRENRRGTKFDLFPQFIEMMLGEPSH